MSKYIGTKAVNLSTTSADVTGNADIDGNLTVGGNLTVSGTTITVDSATAQTVDLGDDDKIRLGDDDDLQIYHDSATGNSVINESGGGNLTIQGNELRLQTAGGGNYFRGINAGASSIFYSNSIRLETTTNGVKAHGNVVSEAASAPELVLRSYPGTQDTIAKIISGRSEFSGTNSFLRLQTNDGTSTETRIDIADGGDISFHDTSGNAKFFWDASAANLGIGTTNPYANLAIQHTNGRFGIKSGNTSGGTRLQTFETGSANGYLAFEGYTKEYGRFDNSGNLLVGKTTLDYEGTEGSILRYDGLIHGTRDGGNVTDFNRLSSDGEIVRLSKDGTTVGSIGTNTGQLYIGYDNASYDVGILFGDNTVNSRSIIPCRSDGSIVTDAVNIGEASGRWRDLYLSGGVYLGGTGSANKLDDYEEGTYTATLDFTSGSVGYSNNTLTYTKIGRVVWVHGRILLNSVSSPSGGLGITLPFTVSSSGYSRYSHLTTSWYVLDVPSNTVQANFTVESGTVARLLYLTDGGAWSIVDASGLASNSQFQVSGFYMT
jgi:hypothetical protein